MKKVYDDLTITAVNYYYRTMHATSLKKRTAHLFKGKVNSVQEACAECLAVHVLKFEISQTT